MQNYSGAMGIFSKFNNYSEEEEFRLAIIPGTGEPLLVQVGDISDIAIMGKCSERLKLDQNNKK